MTTQQRRPRVGDEAWFVEWCTRLAFIDGTEDVNFDRCEFTEQQCAGRAEAERVAREVWPETVDKLGVVMYWPARFVPYDETDARRFPHVGYWEASGDRQEFSGD